MSILSRTDRPRQLLVWIRFLVARLSCSIALAQERPDDFPPLGDVTDLIPLRSQIPGDFFSPADAKKNERTANRLQHDFDIYSWETFIAVCWPAQEDGSPKPGDPTTDESYFTYPYGTVWEHWTPAETVFREKAEQPIDWGKQPPVNELYGKDAAAQNRLKPVEASSAAANRIETIEQAGEKKVRSIFWIGANLTGSTHGESTKTLSEIEQALGTGRLTDRRGLFVLYEVYPFSTTTNNRSKTHIATERCSSCALMSSR